MHSSVCCELQRKNTSIYLQRFTVYVLRAALTSSRKHDNHSRYDYHYKNCHNSTNRVQSYPADVSGLIIYRLWHLC